MSNRPPRRPADPVRVRIVGPSSPFDPRRLEAGVHRLQRAGFEVADTADVLRAGHAFLNGTDAQRTDDLHAALLDEHCDVLWLARGGYGLTRLLHRIRFPEAVPIVVGFSDATALQAAMLQRGLRSVHGPLATSLADESEESFQQTLAILSGKCPEPWSLQRLTGQGTVDGPLVVANLCVLTHLVGTPYFPTLSGRILVLEEVGERPYRIDRMLTQLLSAGALAGVAGVVLGQWIGCEERTPAPGRPQAPSALEVVRERLEALSVPVAYGLPCGHAAPNHSFPQGAWSTLRIEDDGATLELDEGLFEARSANA